MDKGIEYILEVARCGGITKAAENLFITPSALSKFVQAREAELQVRLFHRVGKRFVLTQAGEYYVQKIGEIERIQRELDTQMSSFSSMSRGVIRIGVQATFTEVMFRFILPELKEAFPGIRILMHERTVGELVQMVKGRQLDVLLAVIDKQEHGFCYETVHQCELVMAAVGTHPVVQKAVPKPGFRYPWIDLSYCCDQPNVMLMPGSPYRTYADNLYGYYQLEAGYRL
ncbi:MAG: LysR family transcriptional regulator [Enterocloster clostridioformis]